jgi:hypothetical protein
MNRRNIRVTLPLFVLAALGVVGGCTNAAKPGESLSAIRLNPTPAEVTLNETKDEIDNRIYGITFDQNWLMMTRDAGRVMLLERPSRLAPEPIAY